MRNRPLPGKAKLRLPEIELRCLFQAPIALASQENPSLLLRPRSWVTKLIQHWPYSTPAAHWLALYVTTLLPAGVFLVLRAMAKHTASH